MVFAKIQIIKAKAKNNITASITKHSDGSFKSFNFSGNLVELEGYVTKDGKNYDKQLVEIDCVTTAIQYNQEIGEAIYERCGEIFAERELNNDPNPAVDLVLEVKTVRPKETNILLVNIKSMYVDDKTQPVDTSDRVDDVIAKLKANSAASAKARSQVSSARAGLSNLVKRAVKTYL